MRGIAAFLVFLFHFHHWIRSPLTDNAFVLNGYLWVDFFFILSGFVIFHSYAEKVRSWAEIRQFIVRRFARLYPLHLFTLFVFVGFEYFACLVKRPAGAVVSTTVVFFMKHYRSFVANLMLATSMHLSNGLSYNFPSWSIGAEFYTCILFALAVRFAGGHGNHRRFFAVSFVLAVSGYVFFYQMLKTLDLTFNFGFLRCLAGFCLGVSGYAAYRELTGKISQGTASLAALLSLIAIFTFMSHGIAPSDKFIMPLIFLFLTVSLALSGDSSFITRVLMLPKLKWLGARSYSLYLNHAAVIFLVSILLRRFAFGTSMNIVIQLVSSIALLALSDLTYRQIERRFWSPRTPLTPENATALLQPVNDKAA